MRYTVLVADDDDSIRDLLLMMLAEAGYATIEANNGHKAVELVLEHRPDVVLLDVMMPIMDGFAACRAIRADPRTADIPVLFLTALAHTSSLVRGFDDGATDYITKPFEPAEMLARLRIALTQKSRIDALKAQVRDLNATPVSPALSPDPSSIGRLRVFIASPSDVVTERTTVARAIDALNRVLAQDRDVILEAVRWETHTTPDVGRPQAVVNRQIGSYDIFVGIMWKRFGSPTGKADSGTQEEFEGALELHKAVRRPRILFYFREAPFFPRTQDDAEQTRRVLAFRESVQQQMLVGTYKTPRQFERLIREHLEQAVKDLLSPLDDHGS